MGHTVEAKCRECGEDFEVKHGGGFTSHLVGCDRCGRAKFMHFHELGELHRKWVKGLPMPYCSSTAEEDLYIQKYVPIEPISDEEYHHGIEALAGECKCGGKYTLDAPPRCPKCRSTKIEEGQTTECYD